MPVEIPTLDTPRLRLRGQLPDDFPPYAEMWADPVVLRHIRELPFTREESWMRFLRHVGHWAMFGFGFWIVEEKSTGRFTGEVGLADFHRTIEPSLEGTQEMGWVLAAHAHGKGYATEAAQAVLAWGRAHPGGTRTTCIIAPGNIPSIRVAHKCGFREVQPTTYMGHAVVLFEIPGFRHD